VGERKPVGHGEGVVKKEEGDESPIENRSAFKNPRQTRERKVGGLLLPSIKESSELNSAGARESTKVPSLGGSFRR